MIPPVSEPIIYLLGFGLGFAPLVSQVSVNGTSIPYLEFLAPGMIGAGILFQSFFEAVYGTFIRMRFQGVWQAMLTAPLSFGDVFLGDLLWATTKGVLTGFLTGLVAVLWGILSISSLITHLPVIVIGALVFSALGMLASGLVRSIDEINVPAFLLVIPMPLFGGAYFPREVLPPVIEIPSRYIPLTALLELLRTPLPDMGGKALISFLGLIFWFFLLCWPASKLLKRKVIH